MTTRVRERRHPAAVPDAWSWNLPAAERMQFVRLRHTVWRLPAGELGRYALFWDGSSYGSGRPHSEVVLIPVEEAGGLLPLSELAAQLSRRGLTWRDSAGCIAATVLDEDSGLQLLGPDVKPTRR